MTQQDSIPLASQLRYFRYEHRWSQYQVAIATGISQPTLSLFEHGLRGLNKSQEERLTQFLKAQQEQDGTANVNRNELSDPAPATSTTPKTKEASGTEASSSSGSPGTSSANATITGFRFSF